MGSVSLLTREGEVEIAKRIEQGEHTVLSAILNSPVAVREIIDLGDKLRKHKIRVKEIIRDAEDEDAEFDEEEADRRILRLIDKVKHLDKVAQDLKESLATCAASRKKGIEAEVDANRQKMVETLEEMRLNKKTIDKVVAKLRAPHPEGRARRERRRRAREARRRRHGRSSARRRASRAATRRPSASSRSKYGVTPDEVLGAHSAAQKNLKKVEEELQLDVKELRETYEAIREGERIADKRQGRAGRGEPPPRRLHREEVHEPRPAVPRPHPGGEHRPDEGRRQVRVQARLQVHRPTPRGGSGRPSPAPSPTRRAPSASRST